MFTYSQYGEEEILLNFFEQKQGGVIVDVGACDGLTYSNSRFLIHHLAWRGLLVEPHPEFFSNLERLYENDDNVSIRNVACFDEETTVDFHIFSEGIDSCASTISEEFKQKMIGAYGDKFKKEPIKVQAVTLKSLLSEYDHVDFLSVDCEGVDMKVLRSNDWSKNRPSLVCVEHSMDEDELKDFIQSIGYVEYAKNAGNTFFRPEPKEL
ncbi:MAG: hypothetical protein CMO80_16130 [Verrucomicrobiales bacterium]|nr:hypothetical protein [Verrucomicrobiales bacterium]